MSLPWQLLPKSFGDSRRSRSFQLGPVSRRHVLEQVRFPTVERPTTDLAARPYQRTKPDSAHDPLCGPGGAEAGGYVLIDEPGGLLSISTNYDKRLHCLWDQRVQMCEINFNESVCVFQLLLFFCECLLGYKDTNVS